MGIEDYQSHLNIVHSSATRLRVPGVSSEAVSSEGALEGLSELETILRSGGEASPVLFDVDQAFNGSFMSLFKRRVFGEYLEWKKNALYMTLEDFLDHPEYVQFRVEEPEPDILEDYSEVDESKFLEPEDDFRLTGIETKMYTIPLGIDDDGFDIWTIDDIDIEGLGSSEELSVEGFNFSSLETDPLVQCTEHYGEDSDGFDVWFDPASEVEVVVEEEEDSPFTEPFGVDEDGYDLWYEVTEDSFIDSVTDDADGWDHSEDEDRRGLGELLSTWQGTDEDGYDVWVSPRNGEATLTEAESSEGTLGVLNTEPHGEDSDGFDVWTPPVTIPEETSKGAVSLSPGTVSAGARVGVQHKNFKSAPNSRVIKTSEDRTAEFLLTSADKVRKLSKRFGKFMIS